ncbi:Transmembrane and TPR repeat-containing protein 4 [Orchesella cincta]|uniref:dolichyl-phosphate-mannose--protein mannosyltransferase n=1 Tax=Orchesella cincta TaxID=48709 RepID=A0A1D2N705_ORCCI|nr:Transmembrane and TPR repeat-containing protein 4 [Orchesella cincta]
MDITHRLSHKSFRPLTTLTYRYRFMNNKMINLMKWNVHNIIAKFNFRLDYYIWGHNPFPFHLLDLLIHGINCVLVFIFLSKCVKPKSELISSKGESLAFWGTLLFSVHPVHVEPLGAIVGRADLFGAMIFLGAFCFVNDHRSYKGVIFISMFSIVGSLFKETAITLSVFILLLELWNTWIVSPDEPKRSSTLRCFLTVTLAGSFVVWRLWLQDGPPIFQPFDNPPAFAPSLFSRVASIIYIWVLNVFILLNPVWLCYDWSMGCVDIIESFWDLRVVVVILFLIVCLRLALLAFKHRLIMLSILIFASTFLPSSNLLFTVGFVLAERNLYLPSIGYCIFVAYVFLRLEQKKCLIFLIIIFYIRSCQRSMDWMNQGTLFRSGLQVCPNNAKVHYNLGTMYGDLSDRKSAEKSYKTAISLKGDYYQAMNNLGNLLRVNNELKEAEIWLRKAVEIKSDFAAAWMNLGIILSTSNKSEALSCYHNALKFRKSYPDCEYNLGNLYLDMGDKENALKAWERATSLKHTHSQAWINTVILLEQEGKLQEARETAVRALQVLKSEHTLHFILGNILGKLSEFESAKTSFEQAIKICSQLNKRIPPKYFSNLGVLYHRWGKKSQAIELYQKALIIDPHMTSAKKNLEMLMKK